MVKIFAVGHRKIIDFPALAKNDKQLSFLQKSDAFLPQFNLGGKEFAVANSVQRG